MRALAIALGGFAALGFLGALAAQAPKAEAYLSWTAAQAQETAKQMYVKGRVKGTRRLLNSETALSYKLAATWFTPEVIRATARTMQLRDRLTDDQTRKLVTEAEAVDGIVVMIELDPDEGSGVIPSDWGAFLGPRDSTRGVPGKNSPQLRNIKSFAGVLRRNYDYDRFWMVFPRTREDGTPLWGSGERELELTVRIYDREGKAHWAIPESQLR